MYGHKTGGSLAFTGAALNLTWVAIAGIIVLTVGAAMFRLAPRREV